MHTKIGAVSLLLHSENLPPNRSDRSSPKLVADDVFLTDVDVEAARLDPLTVPLV